MAKRGKLKGNAFERLVGKTLSLWLTEGEDPTQLIRSEGSGGWAGKDAGDQGWRHVADLAPNGPLGKQFRELYAVEAKHQKGIQFWHILTQKPAENLHGWWVELVEECEPYGLRPVLIVKQNHRPTLIGFDADEEILPDHEPAIIFQWGPHRCRLIELDAFIEKADPQDFLP